MGFGRIRRRRNESWGTVFVGMVLCVGVLTFFLPHAEGEQNKETEIKRSNAMEKAVLAAQLKEKVGPSRLATGIEEQKEEKVEVEKLERYRKELLRRPKKRRIHVSQDINMTYKTNRSGARIHYEKGNTGFQMNPSLQVDLGKRKTDIKLEYRWNRLYNNKTPESDNFSQEASIRFARRILPKTNFSLNDRLTRSSVRVVGFDNKKISFDNSHRASLSYDFNRKLNLGFEGSYNETVFPNENWDEQGTLDFQWGPSLSFQWKPKTRLTWGYTQSTPRGHQESSDVTNHAFRWGYSQKVTPKSSVSTDFSWTIQDPVSAQASGSKKYSTSVSYLWQMTPKTGIRYLYSNSFSKTISDSISGGALLKTVAVSTSDSWGASVRFRLHRRINAEFSFAPSHSHSNTRQTGTAKTRSRTFTYPFQVSFDIELSKAMRVRLSYTYEHKIGDEMKTDENRNHTWFAGTTVAY